MPLREWRRLLDGTGVTLLGGLEVVETPLAGLSFRFGMPSLGGEVCLGEAVMENEHRTRRSIAMERTTTLPVLLATALAAAFVIGPDPAAARADWPLWDGKESVADYASRAGIKDVEARLDLGGGVTMKLTLIPAGKFMMGAGGAENDPQLEVIISKPFSMGVYEVTREQWEQVMGRKDPASTPRSPDQFGLSREQFGQIFGKDVAEGAQVRGHLSKEQIKEILESDPGCLEYFNCKTHPADQINWDEATDFCDKLSAKTGRKVSLPTEAQWEYACRAGTDTRFYFGDDDTQMRKYANYNESKGDMKGWPKSDKDTTDGFIGPAPVGSFLPNNWGLYDMHGNVWEWVHDWHGGYKKSGQLDPTGPDVPIKGHEWHVIKGGGYRSVSFFHVWAGGNGGHGPYSHGPGQGFRVIVALE
jgi:formylglycine-generating enzyme required for sulfatase activity